MTVWRTKSKLDTKFSLEKPIAILITDSERLLQILQVYLIQLFQGRKCTL